MSESKITKVTLMPSMYLGPESTPILLVSYKQFEKLTNTEQLIKLVPSEFLGQLDLFNHIEFVEAERGSK